MIRPLRGWKEIEEFTGLKRDTLRRHKKKRGLPLRRDGGTRPILWPEEYLEYTRKM